MKILVADDHALVREGLKHTLCQLDRSIELVEAENGKDVLTQLSVCDDVDLILLDLYMPATNGFELVSQVCNTYPDIPVVVLSATNETDSMRKVLDRGASGFITKLTSQDVMLNALKLVLSGGVYIPPDMLNPDKQIQEPMFEPARQGPDVKKIRDKLTARQMDVLNLLAQGDQNKVIAQKLFLSEHTVKIHITAIFKALNVSNRTQALLAAQKIMDN